MRDVTFILHLVGMVMAVGTGMSIVALKMGSSDMPKVDREPYMLRGFAVTNIGAIGIVLVLLTGILLLLEGGGSLIIDGGKFFKAKMVLVILYLTAFIVLRIRVSKARKTNGGPLMVHMSKFVVAMNILGVMTIVSSVLASHQ